MRSERSSQAFGVVASAVLAAVPACASTSTDQRPQPTVASSPAAGSAFEAIREAWRASPANTTDLQKMIESFLDRFPSDRLSVSARLYLALVALTRGDFVTADAQLALVENPPPGTAHDLWTIARARRLRARGQAEAALDLLRPLVGKIVDPLARSIFEEELTRAALATDRDYEAISYMDAWLRATPDEDRERTTKTVAAIVEQLPKDVLLGALQAMRKGRAMLGYGLDIERILAERLVVIATSSGDADLARMLLDSEAGAIALASKAGQELGELATSRRGLNVVQGRTIGLLLPTESPGLRDEAADVLRGVMWSLGLPSGVRGIAVVPEQPSAGARTAARTQCAPWEAAPPIPEPAPDDGVRLVTRDDAGSADRTEASLDELAGAGAAIVIAGLDRQTAARALSWGAAHAVPVVSLASPGDIDLPPDFAFVLGEPRGNAIAALLRAAPELGARSLAPVIDRSEVAEFPAQWGHSRPATMLPPVSCDIPTTRAGDPRFPLAQWDTEKTHAWMISGSPECAAGVVGELSDANARGVVALTLEAAALPAHAPGLRVVTATAGMLPPGAAGEAPDAEMRRFMTTLGPVNWWSALGRDAATLGRAAMRSLPATGATDPQAVAERRIQARDALASARARLWSSERATWGNGRTMKRTICAVDVPSRSPLAHRPLADPQ
jgi:hypothetical protein